MTHNSTTQLLKAAALLAAVAGIAGCSAAYTSIQPAGDDAYYVTRTKNGFFKTSGALYYCQGQGKKMTCTLVDSR